MLSHKHTSRRSALLALVMVMPLLAGCTFTPVYGTARTEENLAFQYAAPTNRLEQIVYQYLGAKLGRNGLTSDPQVKVAVSTSSRRVSRTAAGSVFTRYEMVATGTVTVTQMLNNKETLLSVDRTAAATYEISGQVLSDRAAEDDARERASQALAETIRLTLISTFAKGN